MAKQTHSTFYATPATKRRQTVSSVYLTGQQQHRQKGKSVERVLKCGREWEGYLDLAKIQNQIFYNESFINQQLAEAVAKDPRLFGFIGRDE